jgi:hypothetical protein
MKKKFSILLLLSVWSFMSFAQVKVAEKMVSENDFSLFATKKTCEVVVDNNDYEVVKTVAGLFADDVEMVSGKRAIVSTGKVQGRNIVIVGTIGHNSMIDKLVKNGRLDVSSIKGGWEQYIVKIIDKPFNAVDKALIVAGCDKRGSAYGLLSISEAMGVSPLYWWADVPVPKHKSIYVSSDGYVSKAPTVKYRGFFINDEDWGLHPWAAKNFEKELGDIGPRTYAKVCELILRMKGNMLAPAMHNCTGAFNKYPENKVVADHYGIMMTSSHCEPLLFNNATEWKSDIMGNWNYITNREGILKQLDKRVSENGKYDNVYLVGLRGIHDSPSGIPGDKQVSVMEQVLKDERDILTKYIKQPINTIPQCFTPYKEVLDVYEKGLKVPDDVTLVWPDDNFGYMKRLSNSEEQRRSGASGVYYHISYLGEPHDYLWLNTTSPTLIYEEMKKAYDTGGNRYWLLNVGDIKPGELGIKLFFDMAWDIHQFDFDITYSYIDNYLGSIYGKKYQSDLSDIMNTYYLLGFQHKPEHMGWGYEWNNNNFDHERMTDTDFSFHNYNEAESRINSYERIANMSERIYNDLPEAYRASFLELVYYPVKGASLMNKKMLYAQQSRLYARQGRASASLFADKSKACFDSLNVFTKQYNEMLNGKWNHVMSISPGIVATYNKMPSVGTNDSVQVAAEMQVAVQDDDALLGISSNVIPILPSFNPYTNKSYFFEISNKGQKTFSWIAKASDKWIILDKTKGNTFSQERVNVRIDWSKAPVGTSKGVIEIASGTKKIEVYVPVFNPVTPSRASIRGMYVEDNGCVSIIGGKYQSKKDGKEIMIRAIKGLGYENDCVQLGEATQKVPNMRDMTTCPQAQYDFYTFGAGNVTLYIYALPVFPIDSKHETRYGVMIDDGLVQWLTCSAREYSSQWRQNVSRNSSIQFVNLNISKPGKHTLKILCGDPGMVIQKAVIDLGGMKRSYLGTPPTYIE